MSSLDNLAPLGIGVVGLGRAGLFHLERIGLRTDCRVVTACDDCPGAVRKASGLVSNFSKTWGDLLRDEAVELVLVATPPASHAPLVIEALSAGKHVLVETPLCLDLPAADAILAAARRYARSVIVAQTRRWESDFLTARQCVESGALGRLLTVKQIRWQYNRRARPVAARHLRESAEESDMLPAHDWRDHSSTGGGTLWEFGVHDFDQLLQLVGETPISVSAELFPDETTAVADDGFLSLLRFPSGVHAHLEVNRASPATLNTGWVLVGSEGSFSDGKLFTVSSDGEVIDQPLTPVKGEVDELYVAVVRHLREGAPNPMPAEQARRTVSLIEAARRAAQSRRPVPVDD